MVLRSHKTYTLKLINLVLSAVVLLAHNGVRTRKILLHQVLRLHHSLLATTGAATAWLICKTLKCNHSPSTLTINETVRRSSHSKHRNSRAHQTQDHRAHHRLVSTKRMPVDHPRIGVWDHRRPRDSSLHRLHTSRHHSIPVNSNCRLI